MSEYFAHMGELEDLKKRREICVSAIASHRESIRAALPIAGDVEDIKSDYIMQLSITLNERCLELKGFDKKILVLSRAVGR